MSGGRREDSRLTGMINLALTQKNSRVTRANKSATLQADRQVAAGGCRLHSTLLRTRENLTRLGSGRGEIFLALKKIKLKLIKFSDFIFFKRIDEITVQ